MTRDHRLPERKAFSDEEERWGVRRAKAEAEGSRAARATIGDSQETSSQTNFCTFYNGCQKAGEQSSRSTTRTPAKAPANPQRIATSIIGSEQAHNTVQMYIMWQCKYLHIFVVFCLMKKKVVPTAELFYQISKRQRNFLRKINTQFLGGGDYTVHIFTIYKNIFGF